MSCLGALYVGRGSKREQCCLFISLLAFSHFCHYPQANWALLVLIPGWVGFCTSRTLWVSPMNSAVRVGVSPFDTSIPTGVFNQKCWGFISLCWGSGLCGLSCSPVVSPGLSACKCKTAQSAICHLPWSTSCSFAPVLSAWLHVSTSPTGLDECFFFKSLVVSLPIELVSSIFCQFWWLFVLKFVVVFFWVVRGRTVYLPMSPSWPEIQKLNL